MERADKKTVRKKRCPNGTRRNKAGKCVSKEQNVQTTAKECPPGKVLNSKTNRCNKIKKKTLKPCPPGKERNPKTNRCRNLKKPKKASPKPKPAVWEAQQVIGERWIKQQQAAAEAARRRKNKNKNKNKNKT